VEGHRLRPIVARVTADDRAWWLAPDDATLVAACAQPATPDALARRAPPRSDLRAALDRLATLGLLTRRDDAWVAVARARVSYPWWLAEGAADAGALLCTDSDVTTLGRCDGRTPVSTLATTAEAGRVLRAARAAGVLVAAATTAPDARLEALRALSLPTSPSSTAPRGRTWLPWTLWVLTAAVLGATLLRAGAPTSSDVPSAPPTTAVSSATPRPEPATARLVAAGYVVPASVTLVGVTVTGRVASVDVAAGQRIARGTVLATLDDGALRAQQTVALARERDAARALARLRALHGAEAATLRQVEEAEGRWEIARAERQAANQQREQSIVRAPTDGTILEVLTRVGETLVPSAGHPVGSVVRMADLTALSVDIDVAERDIDKLHLGQGAVVTADVLGSAQLEATIRQISPDAERARGTVRVRLELSGDGVARLKPGMAVRARFSPSTQTADDAR
jgi:RND family efflux transporter MFP subunit